ncbi:hypothetical protein Tco_0278346 [Tanacetum coccineum]
MQAWNKIFEVKHAQSEEVQELLNKLLQDLQSINEELAEYINTPSWNLPTLSYDDDDDEYSFATQEYLMTCSTIITPDSPKMDSLIMVDKHLDTILETESGEFIKSSVENLVQNPSESEDECECDVPNCDDSQTTNFSTFSNPLFDDSTSSDDESSHEEVIHEMSFKTYLNPLFDLDEEIISNEFNLIHNEDLDSTPKNDRFDTESYLLESLLDRDTLMASSPKIDYLLNEFADNSSPRLPKDFHANPNTIFESLPTFPIPVEDSNSLREEIDIFPGPDDSIPPGIESDDYDSEGNDNFTSLPEFESFHVDYPNSGDSTIDVVEDIPVEDSDSLIEEIDLFLTLDDSIPPGIENDDYDSEGDIRFLEELISNDSPLLHENKSFHFDVPSSPRPPTKPPDDGIYFKTDTGVFTKVVPDIYKLYVHVPNVLTSLPTLSLMFDTLLPFSFENEDKVHILSHRGFNHSKIIFDFFENPKMISGGDIPILDDCPNFEASRARGFVLRSLELQSSASFGNPIY